MEEGKDGQVNGWTTDKMERQKGGWGDAGVERWTDGGLLSCAGIILAS